ncbi:TRAP transporter small permease subunit [Paracoccus marinaquae]|uniref:TRAP transporter small permease protein n=1 Tax=Paracoccus marinaquae TaxID=2841926 RepID=A0ABS6AEG0_9RHOB|nr:TRAP transporter small permease subunit [Paracoccus marinaquae]MBU3028497.1 TRAP transporter small permease subunit [Paracoccus marinaquae]
MGRIRYTEFLTLPPRHVTAAIDWFWLFAFASGWAILCYFMVQGMIEIHEYGDRTTLMSLPLWWAYAPAVLGSAGASLIAFAQVLVPSTFTAVEG